MRKSDAANNVDYTRLLAEIPIPQHSRHGSYEAPPNAIGDPHSRYQGFSPDPARLILSDSSDLGEMGFALNMWTNTIEEGFRTGVAASVDSLAFSGFRDQGLYLSRSRSRDDVGGDEFLIRSQRDGLNAALEWREETFGDHCRSADEAESDATSREE